MNEQSGMFHQAPIRVDIRSLADVGEALRVGADDIRYQSAGVLFPMADNHTNFAGGGLAEGATFQKVHDNAHTGLSQFLNDVVNGLNTLATAALEISAAYGEADAYASTTVGDLEERGIDGSSGPQPV